MRTKQHLNSNSDYYLEIDHAMLEFWSNVRVLCRMLEFWSNVRVLCQMCLWKDHSC
uniref:Uncharacterized protein n=1 Tax=Arundo donax TaxID=35708 RepID=A0A0A9FJP0_ARUDO